MMRWMVLALFFCLVVRPTLASGISIPRQEEDVRPVEARVSSVTDTLIYIDLGMAGGVAQGDRAVVYPEGEPSVQAVVRSVTRHHARIELFEPVEGLSLGTRCDVFLKKSKLPSPQAASEAEPVPPQVVRPEASREPMRRLPEHPGWSRPPDDWSPDGSLLAEANSIAARERPLDWDAHWTLSGSFTESRLTGKRQSLSARSNFGWTARNAFGRGGEFELDASAYHRSSDEGGGFEEDQSRLRLNRLNYVLGGRRGEPTRYEFGRFVQHEMPEFGRLDGVEWGHRLESGRRVGFSAGHMPGLDDTLGSGEDWQVALNFSDGLEETRDLDWRGGYQKTWHAGRSDRDLFLLGARWSPRMGESLAATAWIDWYASDDGPKAEGPELTRLNLYASHNLDPGSGLRLHHSRSRRPFVLRQQFDLPAEDVNLGGTVQRTSLSHWRRLDAEHLLNARLEYWRDEQDDGLRGELGHEWVGLLPRDADLAATLTGTEGSFSKLLALRLDVRTFHGDSFWQVGWQISRVVEGTLVGDGAPIWQHDLRASLNRRLSDGWSLSLNLDLGFGEDQDNRRLGFHLGRRF
ncbi:MAG: hypothetical protein P1V35_13560 [Planctomycetota bacterium]|nr:hypothetical protein [Planctomycetota bacterium]